MAIGGEPSVPSAQSTSQNGTSPARRACSDLAERIFSVIVLPGIWFPAQDIRGWGSVGGWSSWRGAFVRWRSAFVVFAIHRMFVCGIRFVWLLGSGGPVMVGRYGGG